MTMKIRQFHIADVVSLVHFVGNTVNTLVDSLLQLAFQQNHVNKAFITEVEVVEASE